MSLSKPKAAVLLFPGTNCDRDLTGVLESHYQIKADLLWHTAPFDTDHDIYFVPGGFSYGDYLRSGALAARSRSLDSLKEAAARGKYVVGICNGFQILTEAGLLPGALVRNHTLKHICRWVGLKGESLFSEAPENYSLPVSHSEGNYLVGDEELKMLEDQGRVIFRYREDLNGSTGGIAGVTSENFRVFGLMPHPERAMRGVPDSTISSTTPGKFFFDRIFQNL